jgi:hypothetical protein
MSEYQSGGSRDRNNDLKLFPLRNEDLVFSKNSDGVLSCGYKVSNALLNATLGMPMVGGGGGGGGGKGKKNEKHDSEPKTAKLMEDLVIPSSLYYGKPASNSKVFNYKKGKRDKSDKDKKGRDSSSDNESDDDVIEESLYDKLLSLVSLDKKVKYDKKTRKHTDGHGRVNTNTNTNTNKDGKPVNDEAGVKKNKNKNKKTKKVRFAV